MNTKWAGPQASATPFKKRSVSLGNKEFLSAEELQNLKNQPTNYIAVNTEVAPWVQRLLLKKSSYNI